jgi:hypothetical protein
MKTLFKNPEAESSMLKAQSLPGAGRGFSFSFQL